LLHDAFFDLLFLFSSPAPPLLLHLVIPHSGAVALLSQQAQ